MHEPLPKHLLFDYFDGKATALQKQWIHQWLRDATNQPTFYGYLDRATEPTNLPVTPSIRLMYRRERPH